MPQKLFEVTNKYLDSLTGYNREALDADIKNIEMDKVELKRVESTGDFAISKDEESTAVGYSSTRNVDRDNEIVVPGGINLKHFIAAGSPKMFNHNWTIPIGKNLFTESDGFGLAAKTLYGPDDYSFASDIFKVIKFGSLRTSSIGFIPTEMLFNGSKEFGKFVDMAIKAWPEFTMKLADNVRAIISKSILLEDSIVGIPANPYAITMAVSEKSLGVTIKSLENMGFDVTAQSLEEYENTYKDLFSQQARLIPEQTAPNPHKTAKKVDTSTESDNSSKKTPGVDKIKIISVPTQVKELKDLTPAELEKKCKDALDVKLGKV